MKRFLTFLLTVAVLCSVVGMLGPDIEKYTGLSNIETNVLLVATTILMAIIIPKSRIENTHVSGITVEVWVDYIMKRFWKDNAFLKNTFDDSQYCKDGKTITLPQPGSKPTTQKNPTVFPLTAAKRTDTAISYDLDLYATDPTHVQDAEKQEISYDKMDSVLGDHIGVLNERSAEELLIKWAQSLPGGRVRYTSGASSALRLSSGQTGTRKVLTVADFRAANNFLNLDNALKANRFSLLSSNRMQELRDDMDDKTWNGFNQYFNAQTGVLGMLDGVTVFERSDVGMAAAALSGGNLAMNAWGAATGATDLDISLIWQKDAITRALGEIDMYEDIKSPLYLGDIYNASIRFGGRRRRTGNEGIAVLAQGT